MMRPTFISISRTVYICFFLIYIGSTANLSFAESLRERLRKAREVENKRSKPRMQPKDYYKLTDKEKSSAKPTVSSSQKILFIPVTLFDGMDGNTPKGLNKKIFNSMQTKAAAVELDLTDKLDEQCVYRERDRTFFILFYNQAKALGCPHKYLIQKVMLEKHRNNKALEREYLVEVMKVNQFGKYKRADEHYKVYSLGASSNRFTKVILELGCGEIPGVVQGNDWPFKKNILYKRLQDYAKQPGLYQTVNYDFSKKYSFSFEFSDQRPPKVKVPGYSCKEI